MKLNDENRIESLMTSAMSKIKNLVEVDTIVGNPIVVSETKTLVPIAKVSMGFVAGGGEYDAKEKDIKVTQNFPFAGGSGAGLCVTPIGFISYSETGTDYIKVDDRSAFEKLLSEIPSVLTKIIDKDKNQKNGKNK